MKTNGLRARASLTPTLISGTDCLHDKMLDFRFLLQSKDQIPEGEKRGFAVSRSVLNATLIVLKKEGIKSQRERKEVSQSVAAF